MRSGHSPVKPALPSSIGFEAAGVIEALGPDVSGFALGDRVALVPAYGAALIPAASSSVGLAATHANRLHARPIALTRTSAKVDALLGYGAAEVVATAEQDVVAVVRRLTDDKGAHLVFDPVGGSAFPQLARATANGGILILYGALATDPTVVPPFDIFARDLTIRGLALPYLTRDDAQLAALKRFVGDGLADGTLRPTIARTFAFHRFIGAGEQIGKIIVTP